MSRGAYGCLGLVFASLLMAVGARALLEDEAREHLRKGQNLLASGHHLEAVLELRAVQGDAASSALVLEARLLESLALTRGGQPAEGADAARRLIDALPAHAPGIGRAQFLIAEAFEAQGREDDAARIYAQEAALVLGEGHRARVAGYYLALAESLALGKKSADPLEQDVPENPKDAARYFGEALSILSQGKPLARVTLPRARNLLASQQAAIAATELTALLEVPKALSLQELAEARFLRARALSDSGRPAEARDELARLLAMPDLQETPHGPSAQLLLGTASLAMGQGNESLRLAVLAWRRFLELYPDHANTPLARRHIADAFFAAGQAEEAVTALEDLARDARASEDVRAEALFRVGECEQALEHFDRAREAFRVYVARYPDHVRVPAAQALIPELLLAKATSLRQAGDPRAAITVFRQYLVEAPLSARAASIAVEVGLVFRELKETVAAAEAFLAARERYRTHAAAEAARAGFLLGVMEEEDTKNLENAINAYKKVMETFQGTPSARDASARVAEMESVELGLFVPRMYRVDEPALARLTVRNVPKVTVRYYRLDARDVFERRGTLEGVADIEVALVKADHTVTFETRDYRRYKKETVDLLATLKDEQPLAPGAWLVSVEALERRAVALLVVSDIRLVIKQSPHEIFCWAVDAKSGEPRADVLVMVRGAGVSKSLRTGEDGVARMTHKEPHAGCEFLALEGGSIAPGMAAPLAPFEKKDLAPRVSFQLDRPVYRPGHSVRFRAVLRGVHAGNFVTPEGEKVRAWLCDPEGRTLGSSELTCGPFGNVHGTFATPRDGSPGTYRLKVEFAKTTFEQDVSVAAYRLPEYRVEPKPKRAGVRPGEEVDVDLAVSYFFGGPVREAVYEYRIWKQPLEIDRTRYLSFAWFLRAVRSETPEAPGSPMEFVGSGTSALDDRGLGTFTFRTALDADARRYLIQVAVKDTTGQWVSGMTQAVAGPVDRFAVVLSEKNAYRAGDQADVRVVTADLLHVPVATQGILEALIRRSDVAGRGAWEPVASATIDTGLDGEARAKLPLKEAGDYLLRFGGKDRMGAPVVAETRVVVSGLLPDLAKEARISFERPAYKGGETARLHVSVPEAHRPVLLTFEGASVLDYRILRPKAPSDVSEIVLDEKLAPNVVVALALPWRNDLLVARDEVIVLRYLEVIPEPAKSQATPGEDVSVRVTTKDQLGRPVPAGLGLRIVDRALDDLGQNGEDPRYVFNRDVRPHLVTTGSSFAFRFTAETRSLDPDLVALASEKARSLANHEMQRLGGEAGQLSKMAQIGPITIWGQDLSRQLGRPLGGEIRIVDDSSVPGGGISAYTYTANLGNSVAPVLRNNVVLFADARGPALSVAPVADPAFGIQFDGFVGRVPEPNPREAFVEVAGWWPDLVTNEAGEATVSVKMPDNLTTWNVESSGATRGVAVGRGAASIRVSKSLLVRIDRPRFVNTEDRVRIPVVVHSNLENRDAVRLEMSTASSGLLETSGMTEVSFDLRPLDTKRSDLFVKAVSEGAPVLEARVRGSSAQDALRVTLPVLAFGEPWSHVRQETLVDRVGFALDFDQETVPGSTSVRVLVQSGARADLLDGLSYLANYPYGCLEQTVNRFLPLMLLQHGLERAGQPLLLPRSEVERRVASGLNALFAFQNKDGGYGYWPSGASNPWTTALVLDALVHAKNLGFPVSSELLNSSRGGAVALLKGNGSLLDARAALVWALARAGEDVRATFQSLFRDARRMSVAGVSRLLMTAHALSLPGQAKELFDQLSALRDPAPGRRPFTCPKTGTWIRSDLEVNALALLAYEASSATTAETAPLVLAVRDALRRREGGTKAVALALEALTAHVLREGGLTGAGEVTLVMNGKEVATASLAADTPIVSLTIPPAELRRGKHHIEVRKRGGDAALCRLIARAVLPAEAVAADGNVLEVSRRYVAFRDPDQENPTFRPGYSILEPAARPRPVEPPSLAQVVAGQKISIELRVRAREDISHVVILDPQIAGLEVIANGVRGSHDRFERRDRHLLFFKDHLPRGGELVIHYPCYAVHEGSFRSLPVQAEDMYAPERFGRSGSGALDVVTNVAALARVPVAEVTPDEHYNLGKKAFAQESWSEVVAHLSELPKKYALLDSVHDEILAKLLVSHLRLEQWSEALAARDALNVRNPGKAALSLEDRERLGRGFLALKDSVAARGQFQSVLLDAFATERGVSESYAATGQSARAIDHLRETILRYPAVGDVAWRSLTVADQWLALPDPAIPERSELPLLHRKHWREALDAWLGTMAWHPKSALAEEAGHRRVTTLASLGLLDALLNEAQGFLARQPDSGKADEVTSLSAHARFAKKDYEQAGKLATALWEQPWPSGRVQAGSREMVPSRYRYQAGYLLGKIAHVKGDYASAVDWYGRVKSEVPDALQSWAFFTERELSVEPVVRCRPKNDVVLSYNAKNLEDVKLQLYPVDLSVLFAVKKSFEGFNTADLSGIRPAQTKEHRPELQKFAAGTGAIALGQLRAGAYLSVLRAGDRSATTLILVSDATLKLQRDHGAVRVYLVDGQGRPVKGARVKMSVSGRIFHSGETDERGMLDTRDPGRGVVTVVAEAEDVVALGTHP